MERVIQHLESELEKWQHETVTRKVSLYFDYMRELEQVIELLKLANLKQAQDSEV